MAREKKQSNSGTKKGLVTDYSYLNQPEGAMTFALNVVNSTSSGDKDWKANEQGNLACHEFPEGYVPIGQIFISKNETAVFLCSSDEVSSEIGIVGHNCQYTTLVRADLGFKINNQISGTYRLRRGCERTLYFTTPTPMIYNIDKPEDFKTAGDWDITKFNLFKIYQKIPEFLDAVVTEDGALPVGSYNASIQYLDADLNPTEWITTSEPIKIYNSSTSKDYSSIRGATSIVDGITNFGNTNKSIVFSFKDFDETYPFYRVAIIESNAGSGLVTEVKFSAPISTNILTYTYSGISSTVTEGTEEEIIAFNNVITQAEFAEQIENRLTLSKVKGVQINYCALQKYASRIKSNLVLREIQLNSIEKFNPKSETINFYGTGYMPGEMYSFGIVYLIENIGLSPTYHIPGKAEGFESLMSSDNKLESITYQDESCEDTWGLDSEGNPLKDTLVRHHRFPTRHEIGEPLYKETTSSESQLINYLRLAVTGEVKVGVVSIAYTINYKVNGIQTSSSSTILAENYNSSTGISILLTSNTDVISDIEIEEDVDGAGVVVLTSGVESVASELTYTTSLTTQSSTSDVTLYSTKSFGIQFTGIDVPSLKDTNGNKILGYYIVRNERTEDEKTILDSGVIAPMMEDSRGFVAHAHLFPNLSDDSKIDKDILALIHPEHKFNNREYKGVTEIIQEGEYVIKEQSKTESRTEDVGVGTSYDPEAHKRRESDTDGFDLHLLARDTRVNFSVKTGEILTPVKSGEVAYLNTLHSKVFVDSDGVRQEVYNVSGDNKIGIVKLDEDLEDSTIIKDKLPYVILKRNLANPYGNFRVLPYYKENLNPVYFTDDADPQQNGYTTTIFNGDSYVTPMRYHSAIFNAFKIKERATKSGIWKIVVGAILVVAGVLTLAIGGAGIGLVAAGASIAAAGYGISTIASGIETEQMRKVYQDLYEAGIKDTISDNDTSAYFDIPDQGDDEMQWLGDTVTNLWFESSVNMALRHGATVAITDYLDAPFELAISDPDKGNELTSYLLEKLTTIDVDQNDGRLYKGYAGAELYFLNKDYQRTNKQKIFNALGLEYDCCSDCIEDFPGRSFYSEQSFQEELIDNYRVFLPNNYRDIEGEKGVITDVFRIQNNLYIHTTGALWHLPQNIQERVTGDIVSFIGTGDFFSIPPRKITDADKESAGTEHNWGRIKTAHGVLFPSATEGKVFLFDGNSLNPLSARNNDNWFKINMPVQADIDYLNLTGVPYPQANNPSSKYGTGYISVYDTDLERFILTKKDFKFTPRALEEGSESCITNQEFIIFEDIEQTIADRVSDGWVYRGKEDCKLKFTKQEIEIVEEERTVYTTLPSTADVWVGLDMSGSFDNNDRDVIKAAALQWETDYRAQLGWTGELKFYENTNVATSERWMASLEAILTAEYPGANLGELDIVLLSFVNETSPAYHTGSLQATVLAPEAQYITDFENFKIYHSQLKSFLGVNYPIVATSGSFIADSKAFLQHSLAAQYGVPISSVEASTIPVNPAFTTGEWDTLLTSLQGVNPYPDDNLESYNWKGQWNRFSNGVDDVITSEQFATDLNLILSGNISEETIIVEVETLVTTVEYEEGIIIEDPVQYDKSWTISYDLEDQEWVSWHSYLPNFYLYRLQEFYSWKQGNDSLWKHNTPNLYHNFYGISYPHIIEYVDNKNPRETKLWDYFKIQTRAEEFNAQYNEYTDVDITFNKLIAYTAKQSTGVQNIIVKEDEFNYLTNQVVNTAGSIIADRNERDWTLNDLRDYVVRYDIPHFRKDALSLSSEYYIDKVVNTDALSDGKQWYELQSLRDKYLVVRLIFDNFDNIRLVTNFTDEIETKSQR